MAHDDGRYFGLGLLPARRAVRDEHGLPGGIEHALVGIVLREADVHHAHVHAGVGELQPQRVRQVGQRRFAGAVGRAAGHAVEGRNRGNERDAAPRAQQVRQGGLERVHRAVHVAVEHPLEDFGLHVGEVGALRNAGVGYQHVEPPKGLNGCRHQPLAAGVVRDISHAAHHRQAGIGEALAGVLQPLGVAAVEHHGRAGRAQGPRRFAPNARLGTRDNGHLAGKQPAANWQARGELRRAVSNYLRHTGAG